MISLKTTQVNNIKVAVIGGGAAGIMAAIAAADRGAEVTIFERNDRIGKKILSTGNGKCNLSNRNLSAENYHSTDLHKVDACLKLFGVNETIDLFEKFGLMIKDKNGYLYPLSEQAAVVLDVLRIAVSKRNIALKSGIKVNNIQISRSKKHKQQFDVCYDNNLESFDRVILACGSKAAPKTGSDGSGYELAKKFGHTIVRVVPALGQLRCSDTFCKALAGIRAEACVHILEDGREICCEKGEVQLTDYGISGIPVFQLSGDVNKRLSHKKHGNITALIDFLPEMTADEFCKFQVTRLERNRKGRSAKEITVEEFFTGLLNKKLMMVFLKLAGLNPNSLLCEVSDQKIARVFEYCKALEYHIEGHNGFDNAQVCAGGVDMREVTENMESKLMPGIYFAGEILDVDGRCGGYNLQWAWTSGVIAGKSCVE